MAALAGEKAKGAKVARKKAWKANRGKPKRRIETIRQLKPGMVIGGQ
jgi:hypothetical protein